MNPQFCGFFCFSVCKTEDWRWQVSKEAPISKSLKKLTYERGKKEGRKEGRKAGREEGERGRQEMSPDRWPSSHQSKGLPPTFPHWASQKPSQAKTKPNQTRPGCCSCCCCCCCCWWYSTNKPNPRYLLTYCFALTNKQTNQPNQPKTIQPTNQPLFHPPTPKQNKTKQKGLFKVSNHKNKILTPLSLPPSLPPSPLTNP